jgi:hypothetical protein
MYIIVIVPFIGAQMLLDFFWIRSFDYDASQQVISRPFVMFIGASDLQCQGCALFIHQNVDFATALAAVGRIFAGFCAPQRNWASSDIHRLPFPANAKPLCVELNHLHLHLVKDVCFLPSLKTFVEDTATDAKPIAVYSFPLAIRPKHIPDPIQGCSSRGWWPTTFATLAGFA